MILIAITAMVRHTNQLFTLAALNRFDSRDRIPGPGDNLTEQQGIVRTETQAN
jgi:hypothetical protein